MKKILLLLICILVAAYIFKPSDDTCYAKTKEKFVTQISGDTGSGHRFLSSIAAMVVNQHISIKDKILYKEISFGKKGRRVGYGAFGHVFFTSQQPLLP